MEKWGKMGTGYSFPAEGVAGHQMPENE